MWSCNPFAPGLADASKEDFAMGDQRTIDGVFKNFRYAYLFKDTSIYGKILADDFTFIYRNYDKMSDISWGRNEDMKSTYGLFQAAQNLDLVWNNIIVQIGDTLQKNISRSFTLTITFSSSDVTTIGGNVNLKLTRSKPEDVWQISQWRDESYY